MKKIYKYLLIALGVIVLIIGTLFFFATQFSCSNTADSIAMCGPNTDEYLIVSSSSCQGEDAQSLARKGWVRCREKINQLYEAEMHILIGNVTKVEIYENDYFKVYLKDNTTLIAQSPKQSHILYPYDAIDRAPNKIEIIYIQEEYIPTEEIEETIQITPEYEKLNLTLKPGKVWISIRPNMCRINPWHEEKIYEDNTDFYNKNFSEIIEIETKQITNFYQEKEIEIEKIIYGEQKPTCRAKCCQIGYTIYLLIDKKDLEYFYIQGYSLIPNQKTRIRDIFQKENTCNTDSDCIISSYGRDWCNSREWVQEGRYYERERSKNREIMGIPQPVYDEPIIPNNIYCVCENNKCIEKEYTLIHKIKNFFKRKK